MSETVGQYVLEEAIGRGAMATVWRARHASGIGLQAAVKRLHPHLEVDEELVLRFRVEAEALARLQHPNLVRLLDFVEEDGRVALVTELVEGKPLNKVLERLKEPMPWPDAVALFRQIVAGAAHAHRQGCLHRDLKPANVMVTPGDGVKVVDFGIASLVGADPMTEHGFVLGTPAYMAPEQRRSMRGLDARADIYAMGVVLWEMLVKPLAEPGLTGWRIADEDLAMLGGRDLPPWLRALVRAMVQPARRDRPATCEAVLAILDRGLAREAGDVDESTTESGPGGTMLLPVDEHGTPLATTASDTLRPALTFPRSSFVGRNDELAAVERQFAEGGRLVVLLGAGGSGKTRLVWRYVETRLEAWPGGAWFCDLSDATDLDEACRAIAAALQVPLTGKDMATQLGHALAGRGRTLVVLDAVEQAAGIIDGLTARWMARAPEVRFLVTSRLVLRAEGERIVAVDPLPEADAVELLRRRAAETGQTLGATRKLSADLSAIVRELDCLPLAIELAAARLKLLTPARLKDWLTRRFEVLRGSEQGRGRQTTLRGAIDFSWELLDDAERATLAQLAVFSGSFTLEAAEAIVDVTAWSEAAPVMDLVGTLVDHSLLRRLPVADGAEPRFGLLKSVQAYADEQLDVVGLLVGEGGEEATGPGPRRAAEARHGAWFASFGEPDFLDSLDGPGGGDHRAMLAADLTNLEAAAMRGASRGYAPTAVDAACALAAELRLRGPFARGLEIIDSALAVPGVEPLDRARLLRERGWLVRVAGSTAAAGRDFEEALDLIRDEGGDARVEGDILMGLAIARRVQGRMVDSRALFEQALDVARRAGDRRTAGRVRGNLAVLYKNLGQPAEARTLYGQALAIHREVGNRRSEGIHLGELALLCVELGQPNEALQLYEESLAIHREVGNRRVEGQVLGNMANLHQSLKRYGEGYRLLQEALAIHREVGNRRSEAVQLGNLGDLCFAVGNLAGAAACLDASLDVCRELQFRLGEAAFVGSRGEVAAAAGQLEDARALLASGEVLLRELGNKAELGKLLCRRGRVERDAGNRAVALLALEEARQLATALGTGPRSELGQAVATLTTSLAAG
ncbi:MAG: protein kinase [Proteobacteria bacterium]|nr:protein kinase [Pseudomonadota bacterium]